ncbi:MAG: nucleotidyltransferase family protein [Anaerolineales bacterium]|nr:nucleotidyltransferase family protein [Anaerolineales bacterium]
MNADSLMGFSITDKHYQQLIAFLRGEGSSIATDDLNWDVLVTLAEKERVAALIYDACKQNLISIPARARQRLTNVYYYTLATNLRRFTMLGGVLELFKTAGISTIVLKGGALAQCIYRQISVRPMVDIDLFVKLEDTERAIALLSNAGFQEGGKPELRRGFDQEFRVEKELLSPRPARQMVEIHWRLIGPPFACRFVDHSAIWRRAAPVEIEGKPTNVLGAEDWILHQAAHAVYKHRHISLLDLCDVDRLIRHFGAHIDWETLLQVGEQFHWLPALAIVLERVADLFGTPIPASVIARAHAFRLTGLDRQLIDWWLTPGRAERHHIIPDWITAPSVAARARFVWAYLAPSRAYIDAVYAPQSVWQLPRLYLARLWREAGSAHPR